MGGEGDALLLDVPQLSQRKHLKPAAVRQDGAVPAGELSNAAQLFHRFIPGTQVQVIGVAQLHLAVQVFQIVGGYGALDGPSGGHIHKGRGLYRAVDCLKFSPAGGASCLIRWYMYLLLRLHRSTKMRRREGHRIVLSRSIIPCFLGRVKAYPIRPPFRS